MSWQNCFRCGVGCAIVALGAAVSAHASAAAAVEPPKVTIKPTEAGLAIDAGSMGQFVLTYPSIYQKGEPNYQEAKAYKLIEKQAAANTAVLKYAGGAGAKIEVRPDGAVAIQFSAMPADAEQFTMKMLIDFNYSQGGRYQLGGGTEQAFPQDKPPKPHLYQGNNTRFLLRELRRAIARVPGAAIQFHAVVGQPRVGLEHLPVVVRHALRLRTG